MVQIQSEKDRFWVAGEEKVLAEITYKHQGDSRILVIEHTRVSEELRGQGTGEELVKAVVDKARNEGLKIVPVCSYAAHQFKKHPEYQDVLSNE
ncbi:GNAT family N-acetyltransferase [Paenibacillus wynnii]|uniref:Uncharacterized protein n=1 Tax=Paenibacillus wynnii TaxID=268407 RepID=A0A098M5A0_9BACL|nr:GNAT family N-acetyltransferase [Paenibacillus wynnii]KGE17725.1 hypothetical protein PWYN_24480 [Paenibacillus wynnii]